MYCSSSGGFHFHRIAEAGRMSSSASFFSSSRPHIPIHVTIAGPHQHVFQHQPYSPSLDGQTPLASQLMLVDHSTPPLSPSASALVPFLVHGAPTSFTGRKRQRTKASSTFHVETDHALHSPDSHLAVSSHSASCSSTGCSGIPPPSLRPQTISDIDIDDNALTSSDAADVSMSCSSTFHFCAIFLLLLVKVGPYAYVLCCAAYTFTPLSLPSSSTLLSRAALYILVAAEDVGTFEIWLMKLSGDLRYGMWTTYLHCGRKS